MTRTTRVACTLTPAGLAGQGKRWVRLIARAMTELSGDITPTTVNSTLASMSPQPLPLATGTNIQCNGKAVSFFPGICSSGALVTDLDQAGKPIAFKPFDAQTAWPAGESR